MNYIDTGRKNDLTEGWAFAIEPEELMRTRLDAEFIENDMLAMATVNSNMMDRLALFQYMIGNCDYSITGRHNLKILQLHKNGPTGNIPIPYDFDFTGFVNTSYASPPENLGIGSVRERFFLGPCRSDGIYLKIIEEQNAVKEDILCLLQDFEYISAKQKIETLEYIESYFIEAASSNFIESFIRSTCR